MEPRWCSSRTLTVVDAPCMQTWQDTKCLSSIDLIHAHFWGLWASFSTNWIMRKDNKRGLGVNLWEVLINYTQTEEGRINHTSLHDSLIKQYSCLSCEQMVKNQQFLIMAVFISGRCHG